MTHALRKVGTSITKSAADICCMFEPVFCPSIRCRDDSITMSNRGQTFAGKRLASHWPDRVGMNMPSTKQNTEARASSGYLNQGKAEPNHRARKKRTMPHAPFRLKAK